MGKRIEVQSLDGNLVEYLDLKEQKERYKRFFKGGYPSDGGLVEFLNFKSPKFVHVIAACNWSPEQQNFLNLLKFTDSHSLQEINERLVTIGMDLFYNFKLVSPLKEYRITCIELYFAKHPYVEDQFAHEKTELLSTGTFYVHKYQNFKAPFRSGLDISCGSHEFGTYGGILIRGLNRINGPSKALIDIVDGSYDSQRSKKWNLRETDFLNMINGSNIFSGALRLESIMDSNSERPVFYGPRILTKNQIKNYPDISGWPWRVASWVTGKNSTSMTLHKESRK